MATKDWKLIGKKLGMNHDITEWLNTKNNQMITRKIEIFEERIKRLESEINGHIVQMSMSHWVREVGVILNKACGFEHEILTIKTSDLESYIREKVKNITLFIE